MLGQISTAMAAAGLNIHNMLNKSKGEMAYTLVDVDSPVGAEVHRRARRHQGRADGALSAGLRGRGSATPGERRAERAARPHRRHRRPAPRADERARRSGAPHRRAEGRRPGVPARARGAGAASGCAPAIPVRWPAEAVVRAVHRGHLRLPRARGAAWPWPFSARAAPSARKPRSSASALGAGRAVRVHRRGVPPGRSAAGRPSAWCRWRTAPTGR